MLSSTFRSALVLFGVFVLASAAVAQAPATPIAAPSVAQARQQATAQLTDSLQQMNVAIDRLARALDSLKVSRWKAPGDVRDTAQSDVQSMQRDLTNTLPGLVSAAQANPSKIGSAFSVYRNVDALYDVLLRVSETAELAGSNDARTLEDQRASLETTRTQLGAALLAAAQSQDNEVAQLQRSAASNTPAPAPAAKTIVDDGPASKSKTRRSRKAAPATSTPQQ